MVRDVRGQQFCGEAGSAGGLSGLQEDAVASSEVVSEENKRWEYSLETSSYTDFIGAGSSIVAT